MLNRLSRILDSLSLTKVFFQSVFHIFINYWVIYLVIGETMRDRHCTSSGEVRDMKRKLIGVSLLFGVLLAQVQVEAASVEKMVILQRMYVDGEMSEETKVETMDGFWRKYAGWELIEQNEKEIILRKQENDLSPLLKANGFFGVTVDGKLSIYYGKPDQDQIIHSFFQMDVGKLEVYQHAQLLKGIPIKTKEQYEQVITAYKAYSIPVSGR